MFQALQCPLSGAHQTAVAASGFRMNVECGSVLSRGRFVCVCVTNKPTTAERTSTSTFTQKPESATAV